MLIKLLRTLFRTPSSRSSRRSNPPRPPVRTTQRATRNRSANLRSDETTKIASTPAKKQLVGRCYVIDGDTIVIDKTHIRLFGIDAPEMDQPYGKKAKWAMIELTKGQTVTANILPEVSYDRVVAHCVLEDGTDLSEELVKRSLALDWAKYSGGAYREMEADDARKKLWRVAAKHQGKLRPGV